jgi:hypothetical protein
MGTNVTPTASFHQLINRQYRTDHCLKGRSVMGRFPEALLRNGTVLIAITLVFSMLLTACGGSDSDDRDSGASESSDDGAFAAVSGEGMEPLDRPDSDQSEEAANIAGQIAYDRLVIRTAQITLTVDDVVAATASVRNLATSRSGFVFSSTTYTQQDQQYAQLTLRVPADRFDDTISELRAAPWVLEILREESTSQDVSAEYVDNESRLTALEETQRRYLALLADATTIESILRLESELTSVRSQIETIKGRQSYLGELTAFSTITVSLRPADAVEEIEDPDDGFSLARIFQSAWDRSSGALAGLVETIAVVGIFGLFIAPFAALAYIVYRFISRTIVRRDKTPVIQSQVD